MTCGRDAEVEALSRALVGTWNRADWPAYRAVAARGYCYVEAGSARWMEDVDDVLAEWRQVLAAFPDVRAEVVDVLAHGDTCVVGLVWRATNSAPVETPDGRESPSYKRIRIGDSVTLTWRGRRLASERHRIGLLSVLAASVRIAPSPGRAGSGSGRTGRPPTAAPPPVR